MYLKMGVQLQCCSKRCVHNGMTIHMNLEGVKDPDITDMIKKSVKFKN
jgi:hypothetical protein